MRFLRAWFQRLGGLFGKPRRDRDLDEEIESHLQLHTEEGLRKGLTPVEARSRAGDILNNRTNYFPKMIVQLKPGRALGRKCPRSAAGRLAARV